MIQMNDMSTCNNLLTINMTIRFVAVIQKVPVFNKGV